MSEAIIVAVITGVFSLIGMVIGIIQASKKTEQTLTTSLAVMNTEIEELRREVREHNNFARRMPVAEEQIKGLERRVTNLEGKHGND